MQRFQYFLDFRSGHVLITHTSAEQDRESSCASGNVKCCYLLAPTKGVFCLHRMLTIMVKPIKGCVEETRYTYAKSATENYSYSGCRTASTMKSPKLSSLLTH